MPKPKRKAKQFSTPEGKPLSVTEARERVEELNEEYRWTAQEDNTAALNKKIELRRELRALTDYLASKEPLVDIQLPRTGAKGNIWRIGDQVYLAGQVRVPKSVAQVLLHMVDQNRHREMALLSQNGREINLGEIGQRARMAEINAEP